MFWVKIYVNVYRFLRNYFVFFHILPFPFHISWLPFYIFFEDKEKVQYPAPF